MKKLMLSLFLLAQLTVWAQDRYSNPVITPNDFSSINSAADPFVFKDTDGTYYCYVTGAGYPTFASKDLVNWTYKGTAFPKKNRKWATQSFWAPEVVKMGDMYYLHYTAAIADDIKKIGIARSSSPAGPFEDILDAPLIDRGEKGSIDSHIFFDDDGKVYMYFSNAMSNNIDPVSKKGMSEVWVVELEPDLTALKGDYKFLIKPTQTNWEYRSSAASYWNEGAVVLKHNDRYYLMYSANCYCNGDYAVGYATSYSPTGPFIKYAGNPILSNDCCKSQISGPGHHSVTWSPDGTEMICVYHSHVDLVAKGGVRQVNIDRMGFNEDGTIYVQGPSVTPQLYPSSGGSNIGFVPSADRPTLKVTPNPAKNEIVVTFPETATQLSAYNQTGQLCFTAKVPLDVNQFTIPVSSWPTGIYNIASSTGGKVITSAKFIKE